MNKFLLFLLALATLNSSCNKDASIEDDTINIDDLTFSKIDSFTLKTKTVIEKPLDGKNINSVLLGQIDDSRFGKAKAAFYTEFGLTKNDFDFGANPVLDSVVLVLNQTKSYGPLNSFFDINIYEISSTLNVDDSYKNNAVFNVKPNPLASVSNFKFAEDATSVRIPLSSSFGNNLVSNFGTDIMESSDNFKEFFKGMYVSVNTINGDGIVSLALRNEDTKLQVYYHSDTQTDTSYSYNISAKEVSINQYVNDRNGSAALMALENDVMDVCYVSSMSSFKTEITFPDLSSLKNIIVNKADLIVFQEDYGVGGSVDFSEPNNLFLFQNLGDSTVDFLPGFSLNNASDFGGSKKLVEVNGQNVNSYTFHITQYVQSLINGTAKSEKVFLNNITNNEANRIVVNGGLHATMPMSLKIIYTKIK